MSCKWGLPLARLLATCASLLVATVARADEAEANAHFQSGVEHARHGNLDDAIVEFRRAYELAPHFAVLYNLGQAYGLAGQPVAAVEILQRYLTEGAGKIEPARRAEVEAAIQFNRRRIGTLILNVDPPDATVEVDGQRLNDAREEAALSAGQHTLVVFRNGYETRIIALKIVGEARHPLDVHLHPQRVEYGLMYVHCLVPDVTVEVDGGQVARTPLAKPIKIVAGARIVRFSRPGYTPVVRRLVADGASAISCDVRPSEQSAAARRSLELVVSEPGAEIWVNGLPYQEGTRLPLGRHRVDVRLAGFESWSGVVELGSTSGRKEIALQPTPEYLRNYGEAAERRRIWGYVTAGVGVAAGAAAVGLHLIANAQHASWEADDGELMRELSTGMISSEQAQRSQDLQQRAADVQRLDDAALASSLVSGGLIAAAVALLAWAPDPDRYSANSSKARLQLTGTGWKMSW